MDLIYTNAQKIEQGVITKFSLDLEESTDKDKCTFEIQTAIENLVLELGSFIHIDETEYGGQVDAIKIDTAQSIAYASGRTWRGMLGSKVIEPTAGSAYMVVSGQIQSVLSNLVSDLNLTDVFEVECNHDYSVNYQFERYTDAYTGIIKMLALYGHKLTLFYNPATRKVTLGTEPIVDYSKEREITSDMFEFRIEKGLATVNHMIGLGQGELAERTVIHKYLQEDGTVGDTQVYFGIDEIASVFNYPNAESVEELAESTTEALLDACVADKMNVTAKNISADIGDKFTASDIATGINMTQYVIDKIVNIDDTEIYFTYTVGENIK